MLINIVDVIDAVLVIAIALTGRRVSVAAGPGREPGSFGAKLRSAPGDGGSGRATA
jgi:hypothetical protein